MPFSFSKTGRQDFRLTDVQQPKTTATLSCVRSCFAFSAKSGQFDAGSTTTGSIFRPSTPPCALISSIAMSVTSRSETSLIAIVPLSECGMPTLIGPCSWPSWAIAGPVDNATAQTSAAPIPLSNFMRSPPLSKSRLELDLGPDREHVLVLVVVDGGGHRHVLMQGGVEGRQAQV